MLSYQHGFHAGGPADVHKHAIISLLLDRLRTKPKPFCVIDLFAGRAVYDLTAPQAQKTQEFRMGIGSGYGSLTAPPVLASYFEAIRWSNGSNELNRYPGSAEIARLALREGDELIVNELHPTEHAELERWSRCDDRVHVHRRDGIEALTALVPPRVRRGLVIVDPAFEVKDEYHSIPRAIAECHRKWPQGQILFWMPILAEARHVQSIAALAAGVDAPMLSSTMSFRARRETGLRGSVTVVINPPWDIETVIVEALDWLAENMLGPLAAVHQLSWPKPQGP